MQIKNTNDCKALLSNLYPELPTKNWKRISKTSQGLDEIRLFSNGSVVISITTNVAGLAGIERISTSDIPTQLKAAAKQIKHCGDYGHLYYHPASRSVVWVGGDADGDPENGHTDFDAIKRMLKVPGVEDVTILDESEPYGSGWKNLGRHGTEVNQW